MLTNTLEKEGFFLHNSLEPTPQFLNGTLKLKHL